MKQRKYAIHTNRNLTCKKTKQNNPQVIVIQASEDTPKRETTGRSSVANFILQSRITHTLTTAFSYTQTLFDPNWQHNTINLCSSFPGRQRRGIRFFPSVHARRVSVALDSGGNAFELRDVVCCEFHRKCSDVLVEVFDPSGSRDGTHIVPLVMQPGQGKLWRGASLLLCQFVDPLIQLLVLLSILTIEPWQILQDIFFIQIRIKRLLLCQKVIAISEGTCLVSPSEKFSSSFEPDDKNPRPRGLYATIPIPSSLNQYRQ